MEVKHRVMICERIMIRVMGLVTIIFCVSSSFPAQTLGGEIERTRELLARPSVQRALAAVDQDRESIVHEWRALTEINAPSGKEGERVAYIQRILDSTRLGRLYRDQAGNLIAVRSGVGGGPVVVIDAHLDTVFQEGLKIQTKIENGRIYAPGVGDDTRNIEALLAILRALDSANLRTKGDLIFLFSVEEETTMRGARSFIAENKSRIGHFIALDGGYEGFTYGGIGTYWYKHHFIGPGGHTRSGTPPYSATVPLARAITRLYAIKLPADPPTHLNIGMLGGSAVINAKAADAWFSVDLRSTSNTVLAGLEQKIALILKEEAARAGMELRTEVISKDVAAQLPGHRNSLLVKTAEAVYLALGFPSPPITPTASNNSSVALRAGISSISTGAAPCQNPHALTESCEIEPLFKGIKKVMVLALSMAQVSDE